MAASSQSCGVCNLRHITKPSIVWCTECDEGLCTECQEHHSLSKASRRHRVIPIAEYQKLPANVLKNTQYCTSHDKKYQFYCQKHECPCCSKCMMESHKECQGMVELDDVIHSVKTSNALCEIEETLVEIEENLQKIRQHHQNNLSKIKEKRKEIEMEIKKTRIQINNHLDKLQEDLVKQLYVVEEKENLNICQLMLSLENKEKEIADCQRNIMNIKQHATDLQTFLSMKQIEENVCRKEKFLQSLVEGDGQHFISYKINNSMQNIMVDIRSFGEVHIESKPFDIVLIKKKTKQAQMMVPTVQSRPIENIKLTLHKTISTKGNISFGCCILPDGRLAFAHKNNQTVKVFSNKRFKGFKVKMPCDLFDLVYNSENNTLAVTSGKSEEKCILIINLETKQMIKTIAMDSAISGISLKDNRLICSCTDKGIRMINLDDGSISDLVRDKIPHYGYTATFKDNIYHTNRSAHTVTCYNLLGKLQWTFHNKSVLLGPYGITIDNGGNVYVVGGDTCNVLVISPDGQRHREILTRNDGLNAPFALHYSEPNNQLLVASYSDKAFLFNCI